MGLSEVNNTDMKGKEQDVWSVGILSAQLVNVHAPLGDSLEEQKTKISELKFGSKTKYFKDFV
jgi:hypothetical protein